MYKSKTINMTCYIESAIYAAMPDEYIAVKLNLIDNVEQAKDLKIIRKDLSIDDYMLTVIDKENKTSIFNVQGANKFSDSYFITGGNMDAHIIRKNPVIAKKMLPFEYINKEICHILRCDQCNPYFKVENIVEYGEFSYIGCIQGAGFKSEEIFSYKIRFNDGTILFCPNFKVGETVREHFATYWFVVPFDRQERLIYLNYLEQVYHKDRSAEEKFIKDDQLFAQKLIEKLGSGEKIDQKISETLHINKKHSEQAMYMAASYCDAIIYLERLLSGEIQ